MSHRTGPKYSIGTKYQIPLLPLSFDEMVASDDAVRVYNEFIENINLASLGIKLDSNSQGNPRYHPKAMLKLLVFGYSYGVRSSRKLELAAHHNLAFIWLVDGIQPDHKTISEFRRNNLKTIKKLIKLTARLSIELDMIDGNVLFLDGTKIQGNANIKHHISIERARKMLPKIDKKIDEMMQEIEKVDAQEAGLESLCKMNKKLAAKQAYKGKIEAFARRLEEDGDDKKSVNMTDPECVKIPIKNKIVAGYNAQMVVDGKKGFIVNTEVVSQSNDMNQFASQIDNANEILDNPCETACADSGYESPDDLEKIAKQEINVIVPSKRQASKKKGNKFNKSKFKYDRKKDEYKCPAGKTLKFRKLAKERGKKVRLYKTEKVETCRQCEHYDECVKSSGGRSIRRYKNEELREKFEANYAKLESKIIYRCRAPNAEKPFAHIKYNLKMDIFNLRGVDGVNGEMSLLASAYNIRRLITEFGVRGLIEKIRKMPELSIV